MKTQHTHYSVHAWEDATAFFEDAVEFPTQTEAEAHLESVVSDSHSGYITVGCPLGVDGWHFLGDDCGGEA